MVKLSCLFIFLLLTHPSLSQSEIYISPKGSDYNDGSFTSPFHSLQRALNAVKEKSKNMKGDIIVYFREGNYYLESPVVIDTAVSGSNGHDIIIKNYKNEKVVLNGGKPISGWRNYQDHIFVTEVNWNEDFRQLYINDNKAIRGRYPNKCGYERLNWENNSNLFTVENGVFFQETPFNIDRNNPPELILQRIWYADIYRIREIYENYNGIQIKVSDEETVNIFKERNHTKLPAQPFHMENHLSFLDSDMEWFYNKGANLLYVYFEAGLDSLNNSEVVAPYASSLINIEGNTSKRIKNLKIQGITFKNTNWTLPTMNGLYVTQANIPVKSLYNNGAINVEYAESITIEDNHIDNIGGSGIIFRTSVSKSTIKGNILSDISSNAIAIDWNWRPIGDSSFNCTKIKVSNNLITRIGYEYPGAVGIFVGLGDSILIEHNHLYDLSYTGISVGVGHNIYPTNLKNNVIRYNYINQALTLLADGAGIYTLSNQPGTVIYHNYIENVTINAWNPPQNYPVAGVYLDQGSENILAYDNFFQNVDTEYNFNTHGVNNIVQPANYTSMGSPQKFGLSEQYRQLLAEEKLVINPCYNAWYNIDDKNTKLNITMFPNPTTGQLRLQDFHMITADDIYVHILDMQGREIWRKLLNNYNYNDFIELDVNDLPPSIYIIKTFFNDYFSVGKFIKN